MSTRNQRRTPRMTLWTIITLCLLLALAAVRPEQLQVVLYKCLLVTLGAVLAYWLDRALFPNGRPDNSKQGFELIGAWLRRALIVLGCVLGLTLGL